jgi:hypothetical protein
VDRKDIDDDLKVEMMLEPWGDGFEPLSLSLYYYHAGRTVWRVQGKPKPKRSKKLEKKATSEFFL